VAHVSRTIGMLRSIAIYHGIPLRQPRLRRFYSQFVSRGDLVFDLGAHAGNRTRAFAAMGCRVVAVEPQPDFARLLRMLTSGSPNVMVVEAAVGETAGHTTLLISDRTPTVTTMAAAWHAARAREPDFAHVKWNREIDVEATTLDGLIERFGAPAFVKIDVEGAEPGVLAGLRRPIRALSFEYLPRALDYARMCVERLARLGTYRYNWSIGETYRLAETRWMSDAEICSALGSAAAQRRPGDVYALLDASS
jgi:FkbM family methyltransferase